MKRNSDPSTRFPGYYRHDLLTNRREELGWSIQETARQAAIPFETARQVLQGKATNKKIYPVAEALGLDWSAVHDLNLKPSDFHLAVTGNGGRSKAAE